MHWCHFCYGVNPSASDPCVRCGRPVEGPPGLTFDDQLMGALGHPDGDRAVLAAQTLGSRRVRAALPALRRVVDEDRDPYLAVAALRSAIEIAGRDELRDWLEELTRCDSFMVRDVAQRALP
jgi:HEAT repeats